MKTKKFEKKLGLKKKTIANLNNQEMVTANGGVEETNYRTCIQPTASCDTCLIETCVTCETCETCVTCTCGASACSTPCC